MKAQEDALKKLEHAKKRLTRSQARLRRAATSIKLWERRVEYYLRRASMTDVDLEQARQERVKRQEARAAARKRRAIGAV